MKSRFRFYRLEYTRLLRVSSRSFALALIYSQLPSSKEIVFRIERSSFGKLGEGLKSPAANQSARLSFNFRRLDADEANVIGELSIGGEMLNSLDQFIEQ